MGVPPPPTPPSPPTFPSPPGGIALNASVGIPPTGPLICGFGIPGFTFSIGFTIPIPEFDFPPAWFFALSLNCDLSNPISAEFGFGGGRNAKTGLDKDPEDE